jgi:hypothetical protein
LLILAFTNQIQIMKNTTCLLCFYIALFASAALSAQSSGYNTDRRSFSILYVENPKNVGPYFQKGVPYEFQNSLFWNNIKTQSVRATTLDINALGQQITSMGIGNEIMAKWWNRQSNGTFNLDTLAARGRYNAQDLEKQLVGKSPRDVAALEDAGLSLIAESYVLVISPKNLRTMRDVYDEQDRAARQDGGDNKLAERTERGYSGQAEGYLYKLVYDEMAKSQFYDMWIYDNDSPEIKAEKVKAFNNHRFQLQPVKMLLAKGWMGSDIKATTSLKHNTSPKTDDMVNILQNAKNLSSLKDNPSATTDEQLLASWAATVTSKLMEGLVSKSVGENSFQVWSRSPVTARIGVKEGVFPEKRFYVYERFERADGSIKKKKRAVVRARRVTDNRSESTGNTKPSQFYRVGGLGVIQPGMVLAPKRELGIGVHVLYGLSVQDLPVESGALLRDYGLGAEANLSLYLGKLGNHGFPVGFKIGANYTILNEELYIQTSSPVKANVSRFSVYLRKDKHFLSIMRLGLWAGYGSDSVSKVKKEESDEDISLSSPIVPVGMELGLNLFGGFQAFGLAEYAFAVGEIKQNGKTTRSDLDWFSLYPGREGIALRTGLRFQF